MKYTTRKYSDIFVRGGVIVNANSLLAAGMEVERE